MLLLLHLSLALAFLTTLKEKDPFYVFARLSSYKELKDSDDFFELIPKLNALMISCMKKDLPATEYFAVMRELVGQQGFSQLVMTIGGHARDIDHIYLRDTASKSEDDCVYVELVKKCYLPMRKEEEKERTKITSSTPLLMVMPVKASRKLI